MTAAGAPDILHPGVAAWLHGVSPDSRSYSSTSFEDAVKKAEEPPTPPPRPQKSHSRASSLDLNKLFQQGAPGTIHSLFKNKSRWKSTYLDPHWKTRCFIALPARREVFHAALVGLFLWFKEGNETPAEDRNMTTLVYSSAVFCLGFRGEKWLVAASSGPSSETVYFTGRQRTRTFALRSKQQRQSGSSELYKCLINDR